jgi:hypothetical protein
LEVLFGIREYCEEYMPKNAKTKLKENLLKEQASYLPPEENFRDMNMFISFPLRLSTSSDHISDPISRSDSKIHVHACVDLEPRPKWEQSILMTTDNFAGDPVNPRRKKYQSEVGPHALTSIEPVMPMHFYMVLESDPLTYEKDEGNLYWKNSINDRDLDILSSNIRKRICT